MAVLEDGGGLTFQEDQGKGGPVGKGMPPLHMCQMTVQAAGLQVKSLSGKTDAKVPEVFSSRVHAMGGTGWSMVAWSGFGEHGPLGPLLMSRLAGHLVARMTVPGGGGLDRVTALVGRGAADWLG
jgi:hypothetical protein